MTFVSVEINRTEVLFLKTSQFDQSIVQLHNFRSMYIQHIVGRHSYYFCFFFSFLAILVPTTQPPTPPFTQPQITTKRIKDSYWLSSHYVTVTLLFFHFSVLRSICHGYNFHNVRSFPANTVRKSNVILWLYFGNLHKLLPANVDVT